MLKLYCSSNVNQMVGPSQMRIGRIARGLDLPDDRGSGELDCEGCPDMPRCARRLPVVPVVNAEGATSRWCRTALEWLMEGFALYGASLYPNPNATFPAEAAVSVTSDACHESVAGGRQAATAQEQIDLQPLKKSSIVASEFAAAAEPRSRRRRSVLGDASEKVVACWEHWRREREIKRAVAALAEYDDRTLCDLDIHSRADIERMVRYCRDC
jgi:hypothetical protein